jgi:formate dehydrogenase iron-sulfur subunit
MTRRIYIPGDAAAVAVGADAVAAAMERLAERHGIAMEIVRNGSRGAHFLEPLV